MTIRPQWCWMKAASGLSVLLCWIPVVGFALDPSKAVTQYHLDVWTERDGLPQGTVQVITQTRDGYLWIGTRDGLARFDGVRFTVYQAEDFEGLNSNDIRALCEDRSGRLWIGTFNGGVSSYENGAFTGFSAEDGLGSNGVTEIFEDREGVLWLSTWNGLVRRHAGVFSRVDDEGLTGRIGMSMLEDQQGRLLVTTGARVARRENGHFQEIEGSVGLPDALFRYILLDRKEALWIGTVGEGVCRLKNGVVLRITEREGLPDDKVRTLLEDSHQNLWIGTWSGLCRFSEGQCSSFTSTDGLPHNYVEALYEDREGSLWIGTRGGGLARLRDGKFSNFTTREGLAHNFSKCVFEDRKGRVWVGSHGGGLSLFENREITNFTMEDGLPSLFVWSVTEDREGNIWIGTASPPSLCLYQEGRFTCFGREQGLPIRGGIRAVFADSRGSIWMGGDGGGIVRYQDGDFTGYTTRDGLPSNQVRSISEDRDGLLWIGTTKGLCAFQDGEITVYNLDDGLAHNVVYAMHQDSDGTLWIGTQGGLSRLTEDRRLDSYTVRDGLFQNVIYQVLEDDQGNLWMSGNRGIFSIAKRQFEEFDRGAIASLTCESFGIHDGMKATQCEGGTQPAGWKTSDSRLWFPTANGVTTIDPEHIPRNKHPPPVLIERIWADNEDFLPDDFIEFSAGTRQFRFHYTGLSFLNPSRVHFRYQLEGFDSDWIDAEVRREAYYNELPPGRYRFRVIASNNDGVWNESGASFSFYLPPRFYQTSWFFGFCVALTGFLAWAVHRRRMQKAETQFSLILAERSRIARDLHDTLAQGFAGIAFQLEAVTCKLDEAPSQAQQHLDVALSMVRHSLAEARRSVMNLRSTALDNGDIAGALAETAQLIIADKPVDLKVQTLGTKQSLPSEIEQTLLRVGQEAITNALKHSGASRIQVSLDYQSNSVRLNIVDNGGGFQVPSSDAGDGVHFGLLGMRERAKQVGGRLEIQSRPDSGSHLSLEIPTHTNL